MARRSPARTLLPSLSLLAAAGVAAQSPSGEPAATIDPRLDREPLVSDVMAVSFHPPKGASVTAELERDDRLSYVLGDRLEGGTWGMRVSALITRIADPTPQRLVQRKLRDISEGNQRFQVLADEDFSAGPHTGRLLYVRRTARDGARAINGWLVLHRGGQAFLLYSMVTTPGHYDRVRPLLDASLATIRMRTADEQRALRDARLRLGRTAIEGFTEQRLRSAVSPARMYRVYVPGPTGNVADDTEIGYLSLEAREARRGEVTPERALEDYTELETHRGIMVLLDARAILSPTSKDRSDHFYDVQARYWMSWDRKHEAWSMRTTERRGDAEAGSAETGFREGSALQVIHSSKRQLTREPTTWPIPDDAYLSQVEVHLLGVLLPRDGSLVGEMSFFAYDPALRMLPRRVDEWGPTDAGGTTWMLRTRPLLQPVVQTQTFDASGRRLVRTDWDRTVRKVTEPIERKELRRIWQMKGLASR